MNLWTNIYPWHHIYYIQSEEEAEERKNVDGEPMEEDKEEKKDEEVKQL